MTSPDEPCEVIITAPDSVWLKDFSRRLVMDRLCAAAHNVPQMQSTYWWQGQLHEAVEAKVSLHTRTALVPLIVERTNEEHPYEVPCIAVVPITGGSVEYIKWIIRETQESNT